MSLYKDASLVMIPSAYKDGKLYSIRPTDGDGDFTFSRGSNLAATRVDVNGLIEKGRENLFTYSQDFRDASGWLVSNATKASITETDPNGGATAANITWTGGSGRYFYKNITSGNVLTTSFYVKSNGGGNKFRLFGDGANDLSQDFTATSEWQRFEFFFERGSGQGVGITNASDNSAADLLVAFAQLEQGLVATDYIETTTTSVSAGILEDMPRLDYSGGASCPSLLLEPQRSNLLTHSEYFGGWGNDSNTSLTANAIQSPSGFVDAYKMSAGTSNARQSRILNVSVSGSLAFTTYAKKGEYSVVQLTDAVDAALYANFDLENGVLGNYNNCTPSIEDAGDGWYRCIITWTASANINKVRISIAESKTQGRLVNFAGNGTDGIYIYGAQVESGSYPTSYIPTYGTSQTRSGDNMGTTFSSSLTSGGEVSVLFDIDGAYNSDLNSTGDNLAFIFSNDDRIIYNQNANGFHRIEINVAGRTEYIYLATSVDRVDRAKICIVVTASTYAMYVNGTLERSGSFTGTGNWTSADSFNNSMTDAIAVVPMKQLLYFPTALTSSEAIALTTL